VEVRLLGVLPGHYQRFLQQVFRVFTRTAVAEDIALNGTCMLLVKQHQGMLVSVLHHTEDFFIPWRSLSEHLTDSLYPLVETGKRERSKIK
jgi:hypothetical protein